MAVCCLVGEVAKADTGAGLEADGHADHIKRRPSARRAWRG